MENVNVENIDTSIDQEDIDVKNFMRIPFFIQGVRVTADNMAAIAEWCGGNVVENGDRSFVLVPCAGPAHPSQYQGYVGTYVTKAVQKGVVTFKVFNNSQINQQFQPVSLEALGLDWLSKVNRDVSRASPDQPTSTHMPHPRPKPSDVNFKVARRS